MYSLRNIIRSASLVSTSSKLIRPTHVRSLGYLHRGSRVRGLVRDETEYLVSPKGQTYELSDKTIGKLKEFLGSKYQLPDSLLLQILTHKSFAHGSKPFNEKLAVYGSHFLKYKTTLYSIKSESNSSELEIENLGTEQSKNLISTNVLAEFLRLNNSIGETTFWKKRDQLVDDPKQSGENSIYATTTQALVGGLLLHHGKEVAEQFIDDVLLNQSEVNSLVQIAQRA